MTLLRTPEAITVKPAAGTVAPQRRSRRNTYAVDNAAPPGSVTLTALAA